MNKIRIALDSSVGTVVTRTVLLYRQLLLDQQISAISGLRTRTALCWPAKVPPRKQCTNGSLRRKHKDRKPRTHMHEGFACGGRQPAAGVERNGALLLEAVEQCSVAVCNIHSRLGPLVATATVAAVSNGAALGRLPVMDHTTVIRRPSSNFGRANRNYQLCFLRQIAVPRSRRCL